MPKTDQVKQITVRPRRHETREAIITRAGESGIKSYIYKCIMTADPDMRPVLMKDLGVPEEVI